MLCKLHTTTTTYRIITDKPFFTSVSSFMLLEMLFLEDEDCLRFVDSASSLRTEDFV
jgi:hypothetical protein